MKKTIYRLMGWAALAVLATTLAPSCGKEPVFGTDTEDSALVISPSLMDIQNGRLTTKATADPDTDDSQYNENKIFRLDVFFFDADNGDAFVKAYHVDNPTTTSYDHRDGYLLTSNWTSDLVKDKNYHVYVVANSTDSFIKTATSEITVAKLQSEIRTEAEIYKRWGNVEEGADLPTQNTYKKDKSFLMNQMVTWKITTPGTQFVNGTSDVVLERAAVKFVMDISLTDEFLTRLQDKGDHYGIPSWKYVNFNTVTAEVPGGATTPTPVLATAQSEGFLKVEQTTGQDGKTHYVVTTYAYPQTWDAVTFDDPTSWNKFDKIPAILVSFPCTHGTSTKEAWHYYYIPLTQGLVQTKRNHVYRVNALVSSYGSTEPTSNNDVVLTYEVQPWTANTASIDAKVEDFLIVTPTRYVFKGGSTDDYLTTTVKYYASGSVGLEVDKAYFINKNGSPVDLAAGQYEIGTPANGEIVVKSKVPTNGTYQQIEFTVYLGTSSQRIKEEKVYIRHYPLDFVVAESGSYSSYNWSYTVSEYWSTTTYTWAQGGETGNYVHSYIYNGRFTFGEHYPSHNWNTYNGGFHAKILSGSNIYQLGTNGQRTGNSLSISNNHAYILQITSSDIEYVLGHPRLTPNTGQLYNDNGESRGTVEYYTSSDEVMAPAFMIASQLGAITQNLEEGYFDAGHYGNFTTNAHAAMHCALYKEVLNGKTYTNWRLPTKQEVAYMIKQQYKYQQVMDTVLGGRFYWTLDGGDAENTQAAYDSYRYTRCVREMTPEEVEEINKFE